MRIGFFGGTFDPPHNGHLAVAEAALHGCRLDRVLLAPTGRQPLKHDGPTASFDDRMAMVRLLCQAGTRLQATDLDAPLPNGEPNYTIDTLLRLRGEFAQDAVLFAIVGADSFLDIRRWREPERLLDTADWVVVSRPGIALDIAPLHLTLGQQERAHILKDVHIPVSATEIRAQLHEGQDVSSMLPAGVLEYIRSQHLYGCDIPADHSGRCGLR